LSEDGLEFKSDRELLLTIARRAGSLIGTCNSTANEVDQTRRLLERSRGMRLAVGLLINQQTGVLISMSDDTTIPLVNCVDPSKATFYRGVIDLAGGTALPTLAVTTGTASLVSIVPATAISGLGANQFVFNVYPVDASPETNDAVTVTATLPDGATLPFNFLISGTGESETIDSASAVQSWSNAPTVPAAPV
jgi:hypothetical protein